jgi:hypothetical protein
VLEMDGFGDVAGCSKSTFTIEVCGSFECGRGAKGASPDLALELGLCVVLIRSSASANPTTSD